MCLTYYYLLVVVLRLLPIAKLRQSMKEVSLPINSLYKTGLQRVDARGKGFVVPHHDRGFSLHLSVILIQDLFSKFASPAKQIRASSHFVYIKKILI